MNRKNQSLIECEVRGPITWSDFCEIKPLIEKEFGGFKRSQEIVLFVRADNDIRLKITPENCFLVFKNKIEKKDWSKFEKEIKFPLNQLKNILIFLNNLGYKEAFVSYCDKYEVRKENLTISFKFNTQIGDFFEIEKLIDKKDNISETLEELSSLAKKFDLLLWNKEEYEKIKKEKWMHQNLQSIEVKNNSLPTFISLFFKNLNRNLVVL